MFESAQLKIKRAQKHIGDLEQVFTRFINTQTHTFSIQYETETDTYSVEVHFKEAIPNELALILGDAVHNLRTALDHATWELIGIDGGTQDRDTAFPFSKLKPEYEAACNRIKTPRDDTKKFLLALAAYPDGAGEKLFALNRIDNVDKHQVLTPIIGMAGVDYVELIMPNGETFMRMTNCAFRMGPDGRARMIGDVGRNLIVKLNYDSEPTLQVFFGDVEFFQALPLIETLMDLSYAVSDVIGQFEVLVEGRNWC